MSSVRQSPAPKHPRPSTKEVPIPQPTSHPKSAGVLSDISASASSLLSSFTNPTVSSAKASLAAFSSSSAPTKSGDPRYLSYTLSEDSLWSGASSAYPFPRIINETSGDPSQSSSQLCLPQDEFNTFAKQPHIQLDIENLKPSTPPSDAYCPHQDVTTDGLDVINLLSQPLTLEIFSPSLGFHGINTTHPIVRSFANCDDPVEFLSVTHEYTEDVWGDCVEVIRQAREEVLDDGKGKAKQKSGEAATARLKMIWGHLKRDESSRLS